jgi:hypothetical protein
MKYLITIFLLLFAVSARAQITLEHSYPNPTSVSGFALFQVDSAHSKYVQCSGSDTIYIYNLDHSLDRVISIPETLPAGADNTIILIAKRLFDSENDYAYLLHTLDSVNMDVLRIFKEDGSLLFNCDNCWLSSKNSVVTNTDSGAKMIIVRGGNNQRFEVYSLPGKLPTCSTTPTSAVNPSIAYTNPTLPTSAYPNPSSGQVRIAYELPSGVSSGDLILTTEDGREVKRYHVTSAFSDLLIDAGDLPSGSYFYHLVTEKGESGAQRIVMTK